MADVAPTPIVPGYDTNAAREAGVPDAESAVFLASKAPGYDLAAARKAGVSDTDIVDFLSPPAATPKPTAPVSGTALGMAKAAGQQTIESGAETVKGIGAVTKMVGGAERHETNVDFDLMNRLDQGEDFGKLMKEAPGDLARLALREYQIATPEQRQQIRQSAMNTMAAPEGQVELTGEHMMKAGEGLSTTAQKTFPLTPEEESRKSVVFTKMVAGLTKYVGAAVAGGLPAAIGVAGVDAFGETYDKARTAGRTDDEAMGDAMINGMVQGTLMAAPIGVATKKLFAGIPAAFKGDFVKALATYAESGATLTAFSQVSKIADNVIAANTYDSNRKPLEGVGEHLAETFAAGAVLPLAAHAVGKAIPKAANPEQIAKPVLEAPTLDDAIAKADQVASGPVDVGELARGAAEFGNEGEKQQAKLLQLFQGLNEGEIHPAQDGGFAYHVGEEQIPLRIWDEKATAKPAAEGETSGEPETPPSTISPALAKAQREHYQKLGIDVVYFENDPRIPFDGAVSPENPNTIFLSNDPQRNATQVAAHEVTHVLESTTLPDGSRLADILHDQIRSGLTPAGLQHGVDTFGKSAPQRAAFPEGQEGDAAHADAYMRHLIGEIGADIGGEAPKFQTFLPKVVNEVQARYGDDAAKGVVQKLIAGFQQAYRTLRAFFFKPEEMAEYGQPETQSQHWVTNLGEIHDTLAKMYAERFGTQAEKENAALVAMKDKAAQARLLKTPAGGATEPAGPQGAEKAPEGQPGAKTAPASPAAAAEGIAADYESGRQKAATYQRWLREMDAERRAPAVVEPRLAALRQDERAIVARVGGDEARLPGPARGRLEAIRAEMADLANPQGDTPAMAKIRAAQAAEHARMTSAAIEAQGAKFSPKVVDLTERIEQRQREKAGTMGRDEPPTVSKEELRELSDRELDALHAHIETGALGSPRETAPLYGQIQDELDARGRGAMQDRTANDEGPKFSPKRDLHANPDREYTPEQERFLDRQRATERPTWGDWWNKVSANPLTRLAVETVDRYAGLKKRDPEGYVGQRIANSSEGAKAVWLTEGTIETNGKAYDLKDRNGGARELLKPLKKEVHDFFFWVASHRAEELAAEDREHRFTPEDIATGKTLNRGQLDFDYALSNGKTTRNREAAYADSLRKLNVLNQNILDIAVKRGLLTRDVADVLMKNQFYVPFFRERADGTAEFVGPQASSGMAKQTFGKKLKGGSEKLNSDLVQNWVNNASHIIDAAAKNSAAHQTLETGVEHGIATKLTEQQYNHLSDKQQKAESTWVMVDGKKQYYHIEDPLLFKAVGTLAALSDPFYALSTARVARRVLQVGVTHNPVFAARNLMRDSMQALAVTPQSANVFNTIASGFRESDALGSLNNLARAAAGRELGDSNLSEDAVRLLAGGGTMKIASLSDTGVNKVKIGSLLDTSEKLGGFLDGLGKAMHAYSESVGKGEEFNRIALYKNLRDQGVPHDIASFSAQDLTDFSLSGANVIVRYIRETVPFTNSRAQGLYKVGRALSGSDATMFKALDALAAAPSAKNAAAVTLMRSAGTLIGLTVATMALDALYSDDKEYQQRTEYDRQNYWYFRVGEERFRIPMPFEVGALARIAADTALAFFDDRMTVDRWASNTWASMQNNLGFGFIPQVVSPLIDVAWTGKSGTGQAIEPKGMENLRPEERYTVDNTMAARGASSVINAALRALPGQGGVQGPSPMQIDYLVKGYGGWLGSAGVGTADTAIRSFTAEPARPAKDTWATVTQGLVETSPRSQSRYVDALYTQAKNVEQAFATYKDILSRGQAAEAQEFFQDNRDLIQKYGLTQGVVRAEGNLNKQIRMITNNPDPNVTPEQKRIQIMQLQTVRNQLAEQVVRAH